MAIKKVYIGSIGPFLFDDTDTINDPDGDFAGQTQRALTTDGSTMSDNAVGIFDTNQSNVLDLKWNEDDDTNRVLNLLVGGADRSLTLSGNATLADWFDQSVKTTSAPTFAELTKVGDTDNYLAVSAVGIITLHGTARVTRHLDLDGASLTGPAATIPVANSEGDFFTWDFSKTAKKSVFYTMNVPHRWAEATDMEVHIFWFGDTNAANSALFVRWGFEYKGIVAGEAVTGAGTNYTQDVDELDAGNYTAGDLIETIMTTKILEGALETHDQLGIEFFRDGANDDYDDEARLIAVHILYTQDKLGLAT